METLAAPPTRELEAKEHKSLDLLSSVDMFRYDLETSGTVLPETRQRVYDEELSFLTEAIDKAACTSFVLQRQGEDLVYFDAGQWKPYMGMLYTGQRVAEAEASVDPRRSFQAERAIQDITRGYLMQSLEPGQQMVWYSPYARKEAELYGDDFMMECGQQPAREMGFLYRARCQEDGSVMLETQTVDRSDEDAFQTAMEAAKHDPNIDMEALTAAYDGGLMKKHGGYFFAGRREAEANENAWHTIKQHESLINYHLIELENFARLDLPRSQLERAVKKHTYGVWAAFKKRLDGVDWREESGRKLPRGSGVFMPRLPNDVRHEVRYAFRDFSDKGEIMVGCGGSVKATYGNNEEDVLSALPGDIRDTIFGRKGGKSSKEKYSFNKKMFCVVCQAPPKKGEDKKDCGPCGLCRACDRKAGGTG